MELAADIQRNMEESFKIYATWRKPNQREYILNDYEHWIPFLWNSIRSKTSFEWYKAH